MIYDDGAAMFELPKLTLALQERYDAARRADSGREAVSAKLDLMLGALGPSYVHERCGGTDADSVDVSELNALFIDVSLAYGMNGMREIGAALSQIAPVLDQMERLSQLTGTAGARRGFRSVL